MGSVRETESISKVEGPELRQVLEFLEDHALEENAWVIWSVYDQMDWAADWREIVVCRRGGEIVGAADVHDYAAADPSSDLRMGIDAVDRDAAAAIVDFLPSGRKIKFNTYGRVVQEYLDSLPGITRWGGDLYFTVTPEDFRPVTGDEVVELTPADAHLFDGLENEPNWENADGRSQMYAILKDGIPAASLWFGPLIVDRVTKRRPICICVVYVESAYRKQGLGKRLVSHVTEEILGNNDTPLYWTDPDNIASQSLCRSLGYHQYGVNVRYEWTKPQV